MLEKGLCWSSVGKVSRVISQASSFQWKYARAQGCGAWYKWLQPPLYGSFWLLEIFQCWMAGWIWPSLLSSQGAERWPPFPRPTQKSNQSPNLCPQYLSELCIYPACIQIFFYVICADRVSKLQILGTSPVWTHSVPLQESLAMLLLAPARKAVTLLCSSSEFISKQRRKLEPLLIALTISVLCLERTQHIGTTCPSYDPGDTQTMLSLLGFHPTLPLLGQAHPSPNVVNF